MHDRELLEGTRITDKACDAASLRNMQPWWTGKATTYSLSKLLIGASPVAFNPAVSLDAPPTGPYFYFKGKLDEVCVCV